MTLPDDPCDDWTGNLDKLGSERKADDKSKACNNSDREPVAH